MELHLVIILIKLLDISIIQLNHLSNLLIIERNDLNYDSEKPLETTWNSFQFSSELHAWEKKSSTSLTIPYSDAVRAVAFNRTVISISESNVKNALNLFTFTNNNGVKATISSTVRINLTSTTSAQVTLPPSGAWSTPFLPPCENLFNAQVLPINQNKAIITANAADASAIIFATAEQVVEEKAVFKRCFEPCVVESAGKRMLFFRRCPKVWSVFNNLPETGRVPQLLPLVAYLLNDDFSVADTLLLSKGWDTGASFAFDVCTAEDKSIILATVTGLLKKPHLHILQTFNSGKTWKERAIINIDEVPLKVRVAAAASGITVACTFKRHDGYHIMAGQFDR